MKNKVLGCLGYLVVILAFAGCSLPDELGMPVWNTVIKMFFMNDSYSSQNVTDEYDFFVEKNDSIQFHQEMSETQGLGAIEIANESKSALIGLCELCPDLSEWDGMQVPVVPPFTIPSNEVEPGSFDAFEKVTIDSASINIEVTNNTPLYIGNKAQGEPFVLEVFDAANPQVIITHVEMADIEPDNSSVENIVLKNIELSNNLMIRYYGGSSGTNGQSAYIDISKGLEINLTIEKLKATEVIGAQIPDQEISNIKGEINIGTNDLDILGDYDFVGASEIIIEVYSVIPATWKMNLTSYRGEQEVTLQDTVVMDIGVGDNVFRFNSEQYNINDLIEILPDSLSYDINVKIHGEDGQRYDLCSTDSLEVGISISSTLQIQSDGLWLVPLKDGNPSVNIQDVTGFDDGIYDTFIQGNVRFKYSNSIDLELAADILVGSDSMAVKSQMYEFDNPDTSLVQIFKIPLIEHTGDNGESEFVIDLCQEDLNCFLADSVAVGTRLYMQSSGDKPWSGDLKLTGELELEVEVSDDMISGDDNE